MEKMIGRTGRNMLLLLILLVIAIASQLYSCGDIDNNIRTPGGYSISGQITSGDSGVAGVTITLSGSNQGTATSDAAGNYSFSGLLNGSYTLTPALTGFIFSPSSRAQTINDANLTAVNFTATPNTLPTFTLSGTVTSGGNGVAGVIMTLSGTGSATATTDAAGNYLFSGLVDGGYTVTPAASGFTFNPISSSQIISGADITGVNFSAEPAATVQLVACPPSGTTNVMIQDFAYNLSAITVGVNSIVKWTNNGPSLHTVTSGISPNLDGKFNSGPVGIGVTVCFQFLATGAYPYFCTLHPAMSGSVTVQ